MRLLFRAACCLAGLAAVLASPRLFAGENYAFLVAVAEYDRTELNPLKFTREDIFQFRESLVESGFKGANIVLLHDDPAQLKSTRFLALAANIREELELLLGGLSSDDSLIVAFTGHGIQFEKEKDSYFCPRDARLTKRETLVSFADVLKQMEQCKAGRKLLLVDACRNAPQSDLAKARAEVNLESVTRPQDQDVPEGMAALFSCRAGQKSFEDPDVKHGIFFHHVLKGWSGEADSDGDRKLSFRELEFYVSRETTKYARLNLRTLQTPQLKGEVSGDWMLRSYAVPLEKFLISKTTGAKLMRIPGGEYLRGTSHLDEPARRLHEMPRHRVRITNAFYLGRTEVTQEEWRAVRRTNPSWFSPTGTWKEKVRGLDTSKFPVENVSWFDAVEYCNLLSGRDGFPAYYRLTNVERKEGAIFSADVAIVGGNGYRLPTEAEWEYACRAGTTTQYHFGDMNNGTQSNVNGSRYPEGTTTTGSYLERTTMVGSYAENAFGLVDMHGNVVEWCQDGFDKDAYKAFTSSVAIDPTVSMDKLDRVVRGGEWNGWANFARAAYRGNFPPAEGSGRNPGFRLARSGGTP